MNSSKCILEPRWKYFCPFLLFKNLSLYTYEYYKCRIVGKSQIKYLIYMSYTISKSIIIIFLGCYD